MKPFEKEAKALAERVAHDLITNQRGVGGPPVNAELLRAALESAAGAGARQARRVGRECDRLMNAIHACGNRCLTLVRQADEDGGE